MSDVLLLRLPDPEAMGKIRNIVRTAHKWGGDGKKPKFRKIKQVLLRRHPEVIAKAFGGDADKAAAWLKDQWMSLHGQSARSSDGKKSGPTFWRGKDKDKKVKASLDQTDMLMLSSWYEPVPEELIEADELFCAGGAVERDAEGRIWKEALRVGQWRHPNGSRKPLKVDLAFLQELKANFYEGAWEHVTVPLTHDDKVDENTGYVRDVEIRNDDSLWVAIEFTEPEIEEKVVRGTIPNVSVGVAPVETTELPSKIFQRVLKHVALTNKPWINRMTPFAASQEDEEGFEVVLDSREEEFDEEALDLDILERIELQKKEVLWDDKESFDWIRKKLDTKLSNMSRALQPTVSGNGQVIPAPYYSCMGLAPGKALVGDYTESYDGTSKAFVAEYEVVDGDVEIDPPDEWEPVQRSWVQLSLEFALHKNWRDDQEEWKANNSHGGGDREVPNENGTETTTERNGEAVTLSREELDQLVASRATEIANERIAEETRELREGRERDRAQLHSMTVRERVQDLQRAGHAPAVVEAARQIYDADVSGGEVLTLSRDGNDVRMTATEIVDHVLASIPASALTHNQPDVSGGSVPPPADGNDQKSASEKASAFMEEIGLAQPAGSTNGNSE